MPPLPTWKELYDRTESFWTGPLQTMLGSDSYLAAASMLREGSLTRHKMTREALEAYWEALRVPSMADHARLAGLVVQLEHKVEQLHDKLDAVTHQLDAILAAVGGARPADEGGRGGKKKTPVEA
jgi:polyhydroxyalkanoic acid synthase PhaR subunit